MITLIGITKIALLVANLIMNGDLSAPIEKRYWLSQRPPIYRLWCIAAWADSRRDVADTRLSPSINGAFA